jgi:cytochrome P450
VARIQSVVPTSICALRHDAFYAQTVSAIYALFIVLGMFPEAQKKAQEEIDRIIGAERLPMLKDRADLPYIDAMVKELLRWNVVVPAGIYSSDAAIFRKLHP